MNNLTTHPRRLLHVGSGKRLSTDEIVLLEARTNYTEISLLNGEKITVSTNLGVIEERLLNYENFIRPNRKLIVNLRFFERHSDGILVIKGKEVKMSRRRKAETLLLIEAFQVKKDLIAT